MPFIGFPHSFLENLSDFWQRFFADADQLERMYEGTSVLIGQAYLDLVSNVLNVSLLDTPAFNKEYFRLLTVREDELRFSAGETVDDDRWTYAMPPDLMSFQALDNKVIEPSASLQDRVDFEIEEGYTRFRIDPTDPTQEGNPLPGFARRIVDVAFGGTFDDADRADWDDSSWLEQGILKGDTLRLLDVGPDDPPEQRAIADYPITLIREDALYVSVDKSLPTTDPQPYVVLRKPYDNAILYESMTFVDDIATLVHHRLVFGSVRIYAKRDSDGADVVENVDYEVDYERGKIIRLTTWLSASLNQINYEWLLEVFPSEDPPVPPRHFLTGISTAGGTTSVTQMAMWALDTLVDRLVLSNNFGALINVERDSSEGYRAFLRGIFQLYVLGPVLERIESAMNVVLGLPVIRDDGEILDGTDTTSSTLVDYVFTKRPTDNYERATYAFPKNAPIRDDILLATNIGVLTFESFEPMTTGVTVTDYIQDPDWWHNITIPGQVFVEDSGSEPSAGRRKARAEYVKHVFFPSDGAKFGDPGLVYGADESGFEPPVGQPIFRHRLAFVLMDRYLKFHTFFIKFDPNVFSLALGDAFERSLNDLQTLIFSAKPAHTYVFVQPPTDFYDEVLAAEEYYYQPQRYEGGNEDQEIYETIEELPDPGEPYVQLGLFITVNLGSHFDSQRDHFFFTDVGLSYGNDWNYGDYFKYEIVPLSMDFPTPGVPVAIGGVPPSPRRRRIVFVVVEGEITVGAEVRRLVENIDYTFDTVAETLTRLTTWDSHTGITVKIVHLNISNIIYDDQPALGDTPLGHSCIDPANIRADYSGAIDWFGDPIPVEHARDMSIVDRALQITVRDARAGAFSLIEPYRILGFFT